MPMLGLMQIDAAFCVLTILAYGHHTYDELARTPAVQKQM